MTGNTATWRVQFISRADVGAPDRDGGYFDFADEADARTYLASDEVQSRLSDLWRVELRCRPPWEVVVRTDYRTAEVAGDGH